MERNRFVEVKPAGAMLVYTKSRQQHKIKNRDVKDCVSLLFFGFPVAQPKYFAAAIPIPTMPPSVRSHCWKWFPHKLVVDFQMSF